MHLMFTEPLLARPVGAKMVQHGPCLPGDPAQEVESLNKHPVTVQWDTASSTGCWGNRGIDAFYKLIAYNSLMSEVLLLFLFYG